MRTDTCLALMNDKAVELASHGRGDWGCNWNFLVDMNSSRIKKARALFGCAGSESFWSHELLAHQKR